VYTKADMLDHLEKEWSTDPGQLTQEAVRRFFEDLQNGRYAPSAMLDDFHVEGDLEVDAEFVYNNQQYWNLEMNTTPDPEQVREINDLSLPYSDKLIKEDDEL